MLKIVSRDAEESFFDGMRAYLANDFTEAEDLFNDAEDSAKDALDYAGSASDKNDANDLIDEVNDRIDDAEDEIKQADDDGEPTSKAEDLLDEAIDVIGGGRCLR